MRCRYSKSMHRLLLAVALLNLSACSFLGSTDPVLEPVPAAKRDGQFKVSVSTDGKPVEDFKQPLVHRIRVRPAELRSISGAQGKAMSLPFNAKRVIDLQGKIKGIRVLNVRPPYGTQVLGLQNNDLITAVGLRHVDHPNDFSLLFNQLRSEKQATMTLERDGKPHKILYYLES